VLEAGVEGAKTALLNSDATDFGLEGFENVVGAFHAARP
jgi:hypothetical protein